MNSLNPSARKLSKPATRSFLSGCYALKTLNLPDGLEAIGKYAFSSSGLVSITLPGSLENVDEEAFYSISSLTSVVLSEGIRSIDKNAFGSCRQLMSVSFPEGLETIGEGAFSNAKFGSLSLPSTLTTIDQYAFYGIGANSLTIPGSIKVIPSYAFYYAANLKNLVIEEGVETIEDYAFGDCSALEFVDLPSTLDVSTSTGQSFPSDCKATFIVKPMSNAYFLAILNDYKYLFKDFTPESIKVDSFSLDMGKSKKMYLQLTAT